MHEPGSQRWSPFRMAIVLAVALLLALPVAQATQAEPSNGGGSDWEEQADADVGVCSEDGGVADLDFQTDDAGNIIGVIVTCTGDRYDGTWTCTETTTESLCDFHGSTFPAPTYSPIGPRAPTNPVANPGQLSGGQPTPTPLPPLLLNTLQNRTTAEMTRCTAQGGTPTRTDSRIGNDLHETLVQCKGGGLNGTVCLNTSAGANCQAVKGQPAKQPVLQIVSPGRTAPTPTTAATQATLSLLPVTTPGTAAGATPASASGRVGPVTGVTTVKPGPAKNTDFTSGISVSAWTCYGPVSGDEATLKTRCKDLHNTDFEVYGSGITTQFPKGDVRVGNLPAGQYTVRELIPNGYQLAYTFCDFVPTGTTPPQTWTPISNEYDGYYEFALDQSQTVYCNWFNVPNQPYNPTPTPTPKPGTTVINGGNAGLKPEVTTVASTPTS